MRHFKPFQKGDRVKLTVKNYYRDERFNPLWGGKEGFIAGIVVYGGDYRSQSGCFIDVKWDNGQGNTYRHIDLEKLTLFEEHRGEHLADDLFEI